MVAVRLIPCDRGRDSLTFFDNLIPDLLESGLVVVFRHIQTKKPEFGHAKRNSVLVIELKCEG